MPFDLKTAALTIVGALGLPWLLKLLARHVLSKDLEDHKNVLALDLERHRSALKAETDRDLARLMADLRASAEATLARLSTELQLASARDRTRFELLHKVRADVIAETYRLLERTLGAAKRYSSPMTWAGDPPKNEQYSQLAGIGNQLRTYFDEHRLYFPDETCAHFDRLWEKIRTPTQSMMLSMDDPPQPSIKAWGEAGRVIGTEVPPLLAVLRGQFQEMLGVERPAGSSTAAPCTPPPSLPPS